MLDPDYTRHDLLTVDPLRLVEAVVAGVSFIGAGTIFAHRGGAAIAGITTAASLLMVAVIGVSVGLRYFLIATAVTLLTLLVLTLLNVFERRLITRAKDNQAKDRKER